MMQTLSFCIQREMPTKDGSSDSNDFLDTTESGVLNGCNPPLWPATSYPKGTDGDKKNAITVSGNNYTVQIKKPGQGIPVEFKLRPASFRIELTIDDENKTKVDENTLFAIDIYNSKREWVACAFSTIGYEDEYWTYNEETGIWTYDDREEYPVDYWTFQYNTNTNQWIIPIFTWCPTVGEQCPGETYWLVYTCINDANSLYTQYPGKYKTADKWDEDNLIPIGSYEDIMPYWTVSHSRNAGFIKKDVQDPNVLDFEFEEGCANNDGYIYFENSNSTYIKTINVKSSIPYKVRWKTEDPYSNVRTKRAFELFHVAGYSTQYVECCFNEEWECVGPVPQNCCHMLENPYSRCNFYDRDGGEFVVVANNINLTITDDPIPVEIEYEEFCGNIAGTDHIATMSGGGSEPEPQVICGEGFAVSYPGYWPICAGSCENVGNPPYDYTHWFPGVYNCVSVSPTYDY